MARASQLDRAIADLKSEIEVLQAALARLEKQKAEQMPKDRKAS